MLGWLKVLNPINSERGVCLKQQHPITVDVRLLLRARDTAPMGCQVPLGTAVAYSL